MTFKTFHQKLCQQKLNFHSLSIERELFQNHKIVQTEDTERIKLPPTVDETLRLS